MGVEFKLSDRELPASPAFVKFLDSVLSGIPPTRESWADQVSEQLVRSDRDDQRHVRDAATRVMGDAAGRELVARAYALLLALLTGDLAPLVTFHSRFRFVTAIGIPRTGGSYLTAELYRALGMEPDHVPGALAHDSFPEAGPFALEAGSNSWIDCLKTTAEYMVMVELFFGGQRRRGGKIVVPKKLTQGIYAAGFFRTVMGGDADTILTLRHPAAACLSTYEKSGGLPVDRRFVVRSNIEEWCRRDLASTGCSAAQLKSMDYFDAYLRYWEQYYLSVAVSGLSASIDLRVVAYGKSALQSLAQNYHNDLGSGLQASEFQVSDKVWRLHPDWLERAQPSIERVAAAWRLVGISFPVDGISSCL
jgi:hypothetical protein